MKEHRVKSIQSDRELIPPQKATVYLQHHHHHHHVDCESSISFVALTIDSFQNEDQDELAPTTTPGDVEIIDLFRHD